MASGSELREAVDAFLRAPKILLGAEQHFSWLPGWNTHELKANFPIEVSGEAQEGARLEVIAFPQARDLKFRLSLICGVAICRLDHTDETHANTMRINGDGLPFQVTGPHYHSWQINRHFLKGASTALELKNAEPFDTKGSFDSNLRWFCGEVNIQPLTGGHLIRLPPRDRLL